MLKTYFFSVSEKMIFLVYFMFFFYNFAVLKLRHMKKNIFFAFVALLFSSMDCIAQITLEFEKLGVNNVNQWTNHRTSSEIMQYGDMALSDVSMEVLAKLTNTSDEVIYFDRKNGNDNVKLAAHFYEIGSGWKKMYLFNPNTFDFNILSGIDSLIPGESITMRTGVIFPAILFQKELPLYYISSIVPSMYLVFEMYGYEPVYSASTNNVFLNGVKLESIRKRCHSCGEIYLLTHNFESLGEVLAMKVPGRIDLSITFGSQFYSEYLMEKAFVCNMDFVSRLLPITKHP